MVVSDGQAYLTCLPKMVFILICVTYCNALYRSEPGCTRLSSCIAQKLEVSCIM